MFGDAADESVAGAREGRGNILALAVEQGVDACASLSNPFDDLV